MTRGESMRKRIRIGEIKRRARAARITAAVVVAVGAAALVFGMSAGASGAGRPVAHAASAIFSVPNNAAVAAATRRKVEATLKSLEAASLLPVKTKFAPLISSACR